MQNKELNPFRIEEKRGFYAKKSSLKKFIKLYSRKYPSISNKNSGSLWDNLNFSRSEKLQNSSIYLDKLSQVLRLLKNKGGNLLDIGFGKGVIERELKNSDFSLFGIDISKKSVNELKESMKGNFVKGDVLKIPFGSKLFDFVLCLDVLEHISPFNTFKALREINRVSKPNSRLLISVPLNEGLEGMVRNGINPNAHVRVYTSDILKMELKISGFNIEKEIQLTAFGKSYSVKKFLNGIFQMRKPNLLILIAKKK